MDADTVTTAPTTATRDRLTWIVELMSRYAHEKCHSHDSARLAAAIVAHLKSFASDLPEGSQLADTVLHWLDAWEPILERHVAAQRANATVTPSLATLVLRARYA
jgi:hypothetical protein